MRTLTRSAALIPLILAAGAVISYSYFQIARVASGTTLAIQEPANGRLFTKPLAEITGVASHAAFASINDREILTDEAGHFSEKILLTEGYNVLAITVKDRFGGVREEVREVVYKPE